MTLKELRQQRSQKATRGKAALTEFNTLSAKDTRTEEEDAKLAALSTELDGLEAAIEELDGKIAKEESTARRGALFATGATPTTRAAFGAARTVSEGDPEVTFGFKSLAEFATSVRGAVTGGMIDARLHTGGGEREAALPSTFQQGQGSGGEGFMVPPQYSTAIWELALANDDLFGMCSPEPTQSNAVFKPKDESTPWGAVGVQAYWAAEAAQLNASKFAMTGEMMTLHKLYAFVAATDEILSDAPMLQDRLTRQSARAIRWTASESIMWGTGVGKPTGFMKSPSLVTIAKEAAQPNGTLVVANLLKMLASMLRTGGRPLWIANPDVIPQLGQLTIGNVPAFLPMSQPLSSSPFEGTLLGYPILFSEHADTLGNVGDVTLANLDGYYAVNKEGGVDFAQSIHLFFDQGLTAFRWTTRINGQPYLSAAVQPAKGATAKSHFVALAQR